jgi:signal transduction histidine kinase
MINPALSAGLIALDAAHDVLNGWGRRSVPTLMSAAPQTFELAFASLPQPTILFDEVGRLGQVNAAAEVLLGEAAARAAERGEGAGDALPWLASALDRVLAGADEAGVEAEVATPEGARWVGARLRRMGAPESPRGAVVVLQDLTASRDLDAQLRSAERLATLGTLAAGLAHEVNNPLACVVAGLSFVEGEHVRLAAALAPAELGEAKAALEEARDAALRVGRIVRSLQRFGTAAVPLLAEVDVAAALREALQLAEPALVGRARVLAELPLGIAVRASESLLVELLLALLENAAEGAAPGRPADRAVRVVLEEREGLARVTISDTGAGVPEPIPGRGAKLGVSAAHGIATALGGALSLERAPGGGTTAVVTLPLARPSVC